MKKIHFDKYLNYLTFKFLRQDRHVFIYLVCVGIATLFWFLNALSKNYTVDMDFPVRYTNMPKNRVLSNVPPSKFTLQVQAYGFTLLRQKMNVSFSPIYFDVNNFTNGMMENSKQPRYNIQTNQYLGKIAEQFSSDIRILAIKPDTLNFNFDQIIRRNVKVFPNVELDLERQYQQSGLIRTIPDSVEVSGPRALLDTLRFVPTRKQLFRTVSETIRRNVSLEEIEGVEIATRRVVLNIPIEEYTESQLLIPVEVSDKPDSVNIKLFPNKVKVSFLIGLSRYAEIKPSDFDLAVAWEDIQAGKSRLKIDSRRLPPFVKSIRLIPEELEFIIEDDRND